MSVSNNDDVIDTRDILAHYAEVLEGIDDAAEEDREELEEERDILEALIGDCRNGVADFEHGATLIRDTYFETYAEQLAEDIGAISSEASWPLSHIDWEAAADALKIDYSSVDFDGVEYWGRA